MSLDLIYSKLSSQIESQFPEFIRTEGANFVAFLKAYFEFLEQSGQAVDVSRSLPDNLDIDRTNQEFIGYFENEFLKSIPRKIIADKKLLAKYIREFYKSRGSQEAYRFLFRILYDEEIDFYYPGEDILRASDGRWVRETVIRGYIETGTPESFDGKQIVGWGSGAIARVQEVLRIKASGLSLVQLTVEGVNGEFQDNEIISDQQGNSLRFFSDAGSIQDVDILRGGAYHVSGDKVTLSGTSGGVASGTVSGATDIGPITFTIQNGGSGYRNSDILQINISGGDPVSAAQFEVVNISNTEIVSLSDIIDTVKNVVLSDVPFGVGSPAFAASNVNSILSSALTFSNVVLGSINTISLLNPGAGYKGSLPVVTIIDPDISARNVADTERGGFKGRNAVIVASRSYGAITSISVAGSDVNFLKNDTIEVTNISRTDDEITETNLDAFGGITRGTIRKQLYPAVVSSQIKSVFRLPGRYTDTKGFLSWNNKLQDNDFYQEFSYVLRTKRILDEYSEIVKQLLHPAGTKMFGFVQIESSIAFDPLNSVSTVSIS